MNNSLDVKFDIANMTLEELEEARKNTRNMLVHLDHQILMRKISARKHSSNQSAAR